MNYSVRESAVEQLVIAGWTGRNPAVVEAHIQELEALGVARPASTPIFYRIAASRLTTGRSIQVSGQRSSGEVEFVLLQQDGELWIGVGSDHTDREVETYGVTVSKQMCEKPIAPEVWRYEDVADHWDALILRSSIVENDRKVLYQEGKVSEILHPETLISQFSGEARLPERAAMFCGTLPVLGKVRPAARFEFELDDPVNGQKLAHSYEIKSLPIAG
jgi:hypothetical protein